MASTAPIYGHIRSKDLLLPVLTNYDECYTEMNLIGTGSFGNVMMARRLSDGLIVAIKTVRIYSKYLLKNVRKALREVVIIKKLVDVDVPIIYDQFLRYNSSKKLLFSIVMEYIEGGDMEMVFDNFLQNMNLAEPSAQQDHREFFNEFAPWLYLNLANMHGQGIVHRDIKPSNIMFRSGPLPGQSRYVLVDLGFGCVVEGLRTLRASPGLLQRKFKTTKVDKITDIVLDADLLCSTDRFVGTLLYLPPEALRGRVKITDLKSADIWAAGIVLHEFIHVEPIFDTNTVDVAGLSPASADEKIIQSYFDTAQVPVACRYMPPYDRVVMESLSITISMRPGAAQIVNFLTAWSRGQFPTEILSQSFGKIYLEH